MAEGILFTSEFLAEGVTATDYWRAIDDAEVEAFRQRLLDIFEKFPTTGNPNESTTEGDLIDPVIEALGWSDYLPQQTLSRRGRSDVPDYLLLKDAECKAKANAEKKPADRFKHGLAILEAKAWDVPLDRKGEKGLGKGVPSNQILRYLSLVDVQSNKAIKWGILTNGREWRLYYQDAKSRSEEFLALNLPAILGLKGFEAEKPDRLKVFYAFFRKESFIKTGPENISFHQLALREGQYWEEKVAEDLSDVVFNIVLPKLAHELAENDPLRPTTLTTEYLSELREATLILLYRLLFLLYAEDRDLLPVNNTKYDDYGLRLRVREDIRKRIDEKDTFSDSTPAYYQHILNLCRAVDKGDDSIGLPPYNGGLFDQGRAPLLLRSKAPDAVFAPLFDRLSRRYEKDRRLWINYRDLSVQQLGSIYERFLEYDLVPDKKGDITIRPNIFSRKTSGSYYTPESLVNLIIANTVGPLIDERSDEFRKKASELKSRRTPKTERMRELIKLDPASRILDLRVCDPAMGSGHFLVSLVDYLADRMLILIEEAETYVDWADEKRPYESPLAKNIKTIRNHILQEAEKQRWIVRSDQLDDRHIVRRMILKRCVYGVDKNPMAVELAKVSLWLHTFTVGAPLSFLDHHLRCGDSLFGEFTHDVEEELRRRGSMFIANDVAKAKATAKGMARIETLTDADIAEVKESAAVFDEVAKGSLPLTRFFNVIHALRWMDLRDKGKQAAVNAWYDQTFGEPLRIASEGKLPPAQKTGGEQEDLSGAGPRQEKIFTPGAGGDVYKKLSAILHEARAIADKEEFFHWEVAFPVVWDNWESEEPDGGFDAVIGNPPWDRIKLQEVEWFSARNPEIAHCGRASDRKRMIRQLQASDDTLAKSYEKAAWRARATAKVARSIGHYPLLSGGDTNLYSLFVERAHRLVHQNGLVGLVTPSGIASDKGASKFFKSISTEGRLAHFYDFENKKVFFPDIDSRFKFAVYVAGGPRRCFRRSAMAFFLHSVDELDDKDKVFALGPGDFARVNPNTGTAPIFRTKRDAKITRKIYKSFPVLHETGKDPVWPVKYMRMFDMTNDSYLFKTREELETNGYYPVEGNRLKRGKEEYVPLYEGKMVQAYDHRAANIVVNPENLNRPAQPEATTSEQHRNPGWYPNPQFWVDCSSLRSPSDLNWYVTFKDITASTNMRTMISAIIPRYGASNKLPLLIPTNDVGMETYSSWGTLLVANLNAFAFDFVVRQKIHSTTLNWYIVEQFPVLPPETFDQRMGNKTVGELVKDHVLRLTYTADDMAPFARDMGYEDDPFPWDEDERRHLRARLDALFFILYGLSRDDADYILNTFPIVKRSDEKAFGRYLTRDLILAYMNALTAGDTESKVAL